MTNIKKPTQYFGVKCSTWCLNCSTSSDALSTFSLMAVKANTIWFYE